MTLRRFFTTKLIRNITLSICLALVFFSEISGNLSISALAKSKKNYGTATLRIFSTTDLHGKSVLYDYDSATSKNGSLAQISTIINQKRKEIKTGASLLVDSGDTLYGIGTTSLFEGKLTGKEHLFDIMQKMGYDAMTAGNHDFNYGVEYLKNAVSDAKLKSDYLVANIISKKTGKPVFKTNKVIKKTIKTSKGKKKTVRIGITGVVTTDLGEKSVWKDVIEVEDLISTVEEQVDILKEEKKADIVVVLAHSGIGDDVYEDMLPNVSYQLCFIDGVDVVCAGHTHQNYPSDSSYTSKIHELPDVDSETGLVNGTVLVQEADHGKAVGITDLKLKFVGNKVKVQSKKTSVTDITADIPEDPNVVKWDKTFADKYHGLYAKSLAKLETSVDNYFGMIEDNTLIQVSNEAKIAYGKKWILENMPEYGELPVISDSSYNLTGDTSSDEYITADDDVNMENLLNIQSWNRDFIKIYRVTGAQLKECLEWNAALFTDNDNIVPDIFKDDKLYSIYSESGLLPIIDPSLNSWNGFEVFDGIEYTIDVSKPAKYDISGNIINPTSHRITSLTINGNNISDNQNLIWVCNMKSGLWPPINDAILNQRLSTSRINITQVMNDYVALQGGISSLMTKYEQNWKLRFPTNKNFVLKTSDRSEEIVNAKAWYVDTIAKDNGYAYYQANFSNLNNNDDTGPMMSVVALDDRKTGEPIRVYVVATDVSGVSSTKCILGKVDVDSEEWKNAEFVKNGYFDATANGVYSVLSADRRGNKSIRYVKINNYDASVSLSPKVDQCTNLDTTITGIASENAKVYITASGGEYETDADQDGNFSCDVGHIKADSTVRASQMDVNGRLSGQTLVTVTRKAANYASIKKLTNKKKYLSGVLDDSKYCKVVAIRGDYAYVPKGSKKLFKKTKVYKENEDKEIKEVEYKFNTKTKVFKMLIPNIRADQKFTVYSFDWMHRISEGQEVIVGDAAPNAVHLEKVYEDKKVKGYVPKPKKNSYKILIVSGKKKIYGKTKKSGKFSIKVDNLEVGKKIKVYAIDKVNGKTRKSRVVSKKVHASEKEKKE